MARRLRGAFDERFTKEELLKYQSDRTYLQGSTLAKTFDILSTFSYISGGHELEKQKRLEEAVGRHGHDPVKLQFEQSKIRADFANPWFGALKAITDRDARETIRYAVHHRVEPSRVYDDKFVGGLGRNIAMDPTSFITGSTSVLRKSGMQLFKRLPSVLSAPMLTGAQKIKGLTQGARDIVGEVFTPGYKLKKLGPQMSEFYDDYMDMVTSRRGAMTQALHEVRQMGKPYKRSGAAAMEYIERGVSTGISGLDKYLDDMVKPYLGDIRQAEITAGYDIGHISGYAPHVLTEKGKKLLGKFGGEEGVIKYLRDQAHVKYGLERQFEGSAAEINKLLGDEYFIDDLWRAVADRAQRSASDRATTGWLKAVQQKYGAQESDVIIEQVLTSGARTVPGKMRKFKILSAALTGKIDDIIGGKSTGSLLSGELHAAKKSGVFSATPFKGQAAAWTSRITDISEYARQLTRARTGVKTGTKELDEFDGLISEELRRGGARSSRISIDALKSFDSMYQSAVARVERANELIPVAEARLRGEAMGLQIGIIDPLNRYISALGKQARETKSVRVVREATDDLSEYTLSKHPGVTTKLPRTMSEFLDTMDEIKPMSSVLERAGKEHDKVMRLWKKTVTTGYGVAVNTAFFGRNVFTGMEQNIQQIGALRTMRGIYSAARLATGRGTFKTAGGEVSAEAMERMMRESGQMGSTGMLDVAIDETLYPSAFRRLWNAPERFMQWTESMVREPLFIERVREMTVVGAAKEVKAAHFDYSPEALSATEHAIKRVGLPFYTFTRFNLARQVGKLFTAPKSFKKWGMIQREAFRTTGTEEEYARAEDWQKKMYVLPVGDKLMHVPIPQEAINLATTDFYYQLHPGKQLLEIMATWSGWGSYKYKMDRTKYILKGLVFGTQRRQFAKLTDPETTMREKAMINVGLSLYDIAPETVSIEEFEQYRYRMIQPTKEQEFKAWTDAGRPTWDTGFRVMQLGPAVGGVGVVGDTVIKAKHWWQKDKIIKAVRHEFELAVVSQDIYEMGRGFKPSEQQLKYLTVLQGAQRTAVMSKYITGWDAWKRAQASVELASVAERYNAWVRSGRPDDATDRVYRNAMGAIIGIASFDPKEIGEIADYINHNVQLSGAAFEWAFIQKDMLPEEWLLAEYRKANARYLDARAAQEELKGFDVDQPVDASDVNATQQFEYSRYRRGRVDYEQELIERALGRGETQ